MRYIFADCDLDAENHRLFRNGQEVPTEPQVFNLLVLLVKNPGTLITKDRLIQEVWDGRVVSEATVSARISAARSAIGDNGKDQAMIRTVARRGIELVVPVTSTDGEKPAIKTNPINRSIRYTTSKDGTGIAYAITGDGPPLLRAGHNLTHLELDWQSSLWRPYLNALCENHRLVTFDIRGTGLSDTNLKGKTIENYVDDFAAVADAAELDRFPLLVTLQNTPVAIRYAAKNPDRVSKLIVHNGYGRGRNMRDKEPAGPETDPVMSLAREGWGMVDNGFMRAWISLIAPNASYEEASELITLLSTACPIENFIENRLINDRFSSMDYLSKVKTPTLIMHARNDIVHPLAEARLLAQGIAGAEFVVNEGGNTICLPSDPTWQHQVNTILEFLAR